MERRILLGGDFHKRMKDITTIRGYCSACEQVQLDIMKTIKDEGITDFISLGDWFDGGYGSDVAAALAHTDIDREMSEILKGNFYGLIGNHIHIRMDSNPELFLIQPHPVYKSRHETVRDNQIIKTPNRLVYNGVEIILQHWNHLANGALDYAPNLDSSCKHHVALFHTEKIIPHQLLSDLNMGHDIEDNSTISRALSGLDLAIVGHIHKCIGSHVIHGPNGNMVNMIIPGSMTNTDAGERTRHHYVDLPLITISDNGNMELSYHRQSLHTDKLTFLKKVLDEEQKQKLRSIRGNNKETLYEELQSASFIGESECILTLGKFLNAQNYTKIDKDMIKQVMHSPEDIEALVKLYHSEDELEM